MNTLAELKLRFVQIHVAVTDCFSCMTTLAKRGLNFVCIPNREEYRPDRIGV